MHLLIKVCLLLCVAGALAKRHRPAAAAEAEIAEDDQDPRPSDVIGDVALRDRLETMHRARLLRMLRLRRQQQQQQQQHAGSQPAPGQRLSQNAPMVAHRSGGRAAYADDESYGDDDDGDTLYGDDDEEDDERGNVRGGGDRDKGGDRRSGGRVRSSHRDPYTDVDDGDDRGDDRGDGADNYGVDRRKEKQHAEEPVDRTGAGAGSGVDDRLGSEKARDDQRLRKRMDCIVDRVNHCIEWCRLKPTDNRLRQNRDNEPCRYWKGDAKNKWMQSGICRNGRCS
ncbi:uncharacterized protein LOC144101051 [Amblyomma americanum]